MADYAGSVTLLSAGGPWAFPGRTAAHHAVHVNSHPAFSDNLLALNPAAVEAGTLTYVDEVPADPPVVDFEGCVDDRLSFSFDWFEKFHVTPTSFILGNVLSTQLIAVAVYSAYRSEEHDWDAFVNNAGEGVTLLNQPTLPYTFAPQTGLTNLQLQVTPAGPPKVDTTLDFVFDTMTISPVIQLDRLIFWDILPNLPYTERLEFKTQVMTHVDGSEQRIKLRPIPRQYFEWTFLLESGQERAKVHNLLFNWQSRVFGVGVWHEATFPTSAITTGDSTINVRTTSYADYREGGLVTVYDPNTGTNDILEIATGGIAATSLTFVAPVVNSYSTSALVAPLRTGRTRPRLSGRRYVSDDANLRLEFEITDNESDLADTSAFTTTLNSKVVVDDINSVGTSNAMSEEFLRDIVTLDNGTGVPFFDSPQNKGKRRSNKQFHATTRQKVWEVRQLIHALSGRQTSFYLPTFGKDLVPAAQLLSGSTTLTVQNVGFDRYVNQERPYNHIRIHFVNPANPPLIREITGSSEVDSATENLTLGDTWPATYQPEDVERIEYLELVRFDSDTLKLRYNEGDRTVRVSAPVITVFD